MKNSLALLFILIGLQVSGQTTIDSIKKIEIVDYENYDFDSMLARTYQLVPKKESWYIYNMNKFTGFELLEKLKKDDKARYDRIQKLIPSSTTKFNKEIELLHKDYFLEPTKIGCLTKVKIDSLLKDLERIPSKSIFKELGIKDIELKEKALKYLKLYLQKKNSRIKESQKDYCLKHLQNINTLQKSASTLIHQKTFSDYGYVSVKVFRKNNTLEYRTKGTNYFMLPWFNENNQIATYNPRTSILVGSVIPEDLNGKLLKGENFIEDLYFYVIEEYCLTQQKHFKKK